MRDASFISSAGGRDLATAHLLTAFVVVHRRRLACEKRCKSWRICNTQLVKSARLNAWQLPQRENKQSLSRRQHANGVGCHRFSRCRETPDQGPDAIQIPQGRPTTYWRLYRTLVHWFACAKVLVAECSVPLSTSHQCENTGHGYSGVGIKCINPRQH